MMPKTGLCWFCGDLPTSSRRSVQPARFGKTRSLRSRQEAAMAHLRAEAEQSWVFGEADDVRLVRSTRIIWVFAALLGTALLWAYFARLDEVSTGSGRVVPTMREQVIQSLEGGILAELHVRQDDIVEPGQILAQLDPTRSESNVEESAARYRAALASSARLEAEVNQTPLSFP